MKALVVDSSTALRGVLHRILALRGFEVVEAATAPQAVELFRHMGAAELVLVDWSLAESSAPELIAQLRQQSAHATTIVMMTAAEPESWELRRILLSGANDYLLKPFTVSQMESKLCHAGLAWHP